MQMQSQSVLPPATKLFLDSLKAGAKLQSPTGQPTVAAQAAQSAGIIPPQQPQQPQQGGVPPVTPEAGQEGLAGILDQLKQAQQTGPSVAQNQQQAQQQQIAQQAAQMVQKQGPQPTQNMAEGGLAGLPVDIGEFAEGGVIGYAGPEGSEVEAEEATSDIGDFFRGISGGLQDMVSKGNQRMELERAKYNAQIMPWTAVTKSERAANVRQLQNLNDQLNNLSASPKPEGSWGEQEDRASELNPNLNKLIVALRSGMDGASNYTDKDSLRSALEELQALVPSKTSKSGATKTDTNRNVVAPANGKAPSAGPGLASIMTEMKNSGFTPPDLSEANRLYAAKRKMLEGRPDFGAQDIATASKIQEMAQAQDDRQRQLLQMAARPLIRGGGARMAGVTANHEKAVAARDAAYLRLVDASKQAEYARQVGDLDALQKANAEIVAAQQDYQKLAANLAANMYSSQAGIKIANLNANSREEIAAERMKGLIRELELRQSANPTESKLWNELRDDVDRQVKGFLENNFKAKREIGNDPAKYIELTKTFMKNAVVLAKASGRPVPPEALAFLQSNAPEASGKNYTFDSLK